MKTTEKYTLISLMLLSFVSIYCRCPKDVPIPVCSSSCDNVFFSGNVLNIAYNTPISNAQIQVTTPGDFDTIYVVGNVNTDLNGDFTLLKSVDTATHKFYTVKVTMPPGYLTAPQTSDESYTANTEEENFYKIDSTFQQIQFEAFPITKLQVHLHRSSALSIVPYYLSINYSINDGNLYSIGPSYSSFQETSKNTDTLIYLETSPVLHTIIQWYRSTDTSANIIFSGADSISCQPNVTNQVFITY